MKLLSKLVFMFLLTLSCSCAMLFNEKEVDVSINSNPPGASIFIGGKNYGTTPATIKIEPKKYSVLLVKEGYGTAQLQLDYWVSIRNSKCLADVLGTMLVIPYYSYYWSGKCNDFKQKEYFMNIPRTGGVVPGSARGGAMMNYGQNPPSEEMINYYYTQDVLMGGANKKSGSNNYNNNYQPSMPSQQGYGSMDYYGNQRIQ